MKVAFIACEYNPFHNGHMYHIDETKKHGADAIVCIMSGNFVQRGEISVCEKHKRAEMALKGGANLIIELPLKYAVSTASYFAEGFIKVARSTGLNGFISFGANNDTETLCKLKDIIYSKEAIDFICNNYKDINFAKGVSKYLETNYSSELASILCDPNSVLAVEYIKARDKFFKEADIISVKRVGAKHDSEEIFNGMTSAKNIRNIIYGNANFDTCILEKTGNLLPKHTSEIMTELFSKGLFPASQDIFYKILFSRLLSLTVNDFRKINNVTGGLENRIYDALATSSTFDELVKNGSTKRFTVSRIRQILLSAALGITKDDLLKDPSYIRILGFDQKGREVLSEMRDKAHIPVITNLSQAKKLNESALRDATLDSLSAKIFNLCLKKPMDGSPEYDIKPIIIQKTEQE